MPKIVYCGPHADVVIPGSADVAIAGEPVEVTAAVAKELLASPVWQDHAPSNKPTTHRAAARHTED